MAYFKDGQVRASYAGADGLGDGRINGLQLDRDGTLWAATEGGLSRVRDGGVSTLTSKNGLPCDKVNWVMEDDAHSFWLEMACGLVRIARPELDAWVGDPKRTIHATVFDNSDGVSSHALTSGYSPRVAKSSDGRLWFPGLDGVGVIDPRHLPFNKLPPQVHIEQIIADHRIHEASAHLRLPPLVRDLEIDYTALSLVAPEKVRFRYKLEGLDRDWWNAGNRRQAFYSNLSPGNYRFRVAACNNSGVWNEAGASFEFSKVPAFFQTTWFRCLCVAAFLGLLWALYRHRLHQVAHEFEVRMEERLAERNRIAQELHDNLLQSMLGISLQLEVTDELLPADAGARRPLEKALSLSKAAMAEGRRALNDLRVQGLGSDALVQAFSQLAKDFAGAPAPELQILTEGQERPLKSSAGNDVLQIGRQAIANALQHAHAGRIHVLLSYSGQGLCVRVKDNGCGIDENTLSRGRPGHHGLAGMRERAGRIGASLSIRSRVGEGTEVCLNVPTGVFEPQPRNQEHSRL